MAADDSQRTDAMIARLEGDVAERNSFVQGLIAGAQDANRSLTDNERQLIADAENIMKDSTAQLDILYAARKTTIQARERARQVSQELNRMRDESEHGAIEYRSAGAWALDAYKASVGDRAAKERLEVFQRAAAHDKTSDNLGVVPDPIVGDVINFIDAARPLVNLLGPRPMPSATWHRPLVTSHTSVGVQGAAGAAADEKAELVSQKMTITRLNGNAVTYGGYVNVSRQLIDFSTPQAFDAIVTDLAAQYSIQTEAALGAVLGTATVLEDPVDTTTTGYTQAGVAATLWKAVANVYTATKGQGRIFVACSPDQLGTWGSMFAPYGPMNQQGTGFQANNFGQGLMGYVSGVPVYCSAGLAAGTVGIVGSTAAVEVYEQRIGTLQITEPSVLGVQVAYAGYFTPMTIVAGGLQKIVNAT